MNTSKLPIRHLWEQEQTKVTEISKAYWATLTPPLAPSEADVSIFSENLLPGFTCLLGVTKELAVISDKAIDKDPYNWTRIYTVVQDWLDIREYSDNYIGDGVLNIMSMEDCNTLVTTLSEWSKRLIVRVFNEKTPEMRVAFNFPVPTDFDIEPTSVIDCDGYKFFIWDFNPGG